MAACRNKKNWRLGRASGSGTKSSALSRARRGVILLVLLGILALFGATAFAFLVITSHGNRAAKSLQKVDRVAFSAQQDLEEAMYQVLRGPNNTTSVLRSHSLLDDIYGDRWVGGWVVNRFTLTPTDAGGWVNPKGIPGQSQPPTASWPDVVSAPNVPEPFAVERAGGQLIEFIAGYTIPRNQPTWGGANMHPTITIPDWWGQVADNTAENEAMEFARRVGCVLTILDSSSPMFNKSTRIVGYRRQEVRDNSGVLLLVYHRYQILPFEGVRAADTVTSLLNTQASGFNFIINSPPFSGLGAGFNPATGVNDAGYTGTQPESQPFALLPNPTDPDYHKNIGWLTANEDYDAADFQNMLLALQTSDGRTLSPSLHRPELVQYWYQQLFTELAAAPYSIADPADRWRVILKPDNTTQAGRFVKTMKRRFMLRPLIEDHPDFDGSNPESAGIAKMNLSGKTEAELLDLVNKHWEKFGPWDVDNDGDGKTDSIWVDVGLPIRSLPDGRKYKPLAAILCVDLDGRVNLNTAGSVEQLHDAFRPPRIAAAGPKGYLADNTVYAQPLTQGTPPGADANLARGQGCGSAEITALPVLGTQQAMYRNLLLGIPPNTGTLPPGVALDGRYGEVQRRGADPEYHLPSPGLTLGVASPEQIMGNRLFGLPTNYYQAVAMGAATGYGSPMDLKGTLAVGLDMFGQPIYSALRGVATGVDPLGYVAGWNAPTWDFALYDTPYELKLGKIAPQSVGLMAGLDNPFTVAELEPLLRRYDADILRLPDRLRLLLGAGPNSLYRFQVTTESWDLPVPNLAFSKELQQGWQAIWPAVVPPQPPRPPQHISDLVAARIATLANDPPPGGLIRLTLADALRVDTSNMFCSDALLGLRMDLNRPFGDGQDNNSNNVVDELLEPGGLEYRYQYAKTLYILMMALVDKDWYPIWDATIAKALDADPTYVPTPTEIAMARARAIAQWAVNVVDFRDADSVMTPFEYDIYPFHASRPWQPGEAITTWDVDGFITDKNIPTDPNYDPTHEPTRGVVWGCERPELLITETFATHDRRQYNAVTDPNNPPDYVNRFRPEGSLFVELHNPWSDAEARPAEFYRDFSSGTNAVGVRLNQVSPAGGSPVWRLALYDLADAVDAENMPEGLGYRDPHDESLANPPTLERLVYFVPDTGNLPEAATAKVTFSPSAADLAPVMPRRYAVVGPSNQANAQYSKGATLLGAPPAASVSGLRRIQLNPNPDPTSTGQVQVFSNGTVDDLAVLAGAVQPPVAVAIDKARAGAAGTVKDLRLSISEPANGYLADDPATGYDWTLGYTPPQPAEDVYRTDGWGATGDPPVWTGPLATAGVTPALRYVHLQRLADPLMPYHPTTNPYRSIDSAPVDLTVFDSQMDAGSHAWCQGTFPAAYVQAGNPPGNSLVSRQRGQDNVAAKSAAFWTALVVPNPETATGLPNFKNTKPLVTGEDPTNVHFRGDLGHSLGYLNDFFFDQSPLDPTDFGLPLVYGGAPGAEAGVSGSLTFTPDPLPWLTWLNRPFANPLELLQVPALHSSRLLLSYENDVTKAPEVYTGGKDGFAHLGPFFSALRKDNQTQKNSGKLRGVTSNDAALWTSLVPNFYRLLEYVHVPSRFVDAQVQGTVAAMSNPAEPHLFHPPFNFIPTYREPGKINLNTIFDHRQDPSGYQPIYQALANDHPLPSWIDFMTARRGYASVAAGGDPDYGFEAGSPALPTRFANPFRSFAGQWLVPPVPGRDAGGTNPLYLQQIVQEGINATLLRAQHGTADPPPTLDQRPPLFTFAATPNPIPYASTVKNPFFQYQSLQRLSNLATTRSNVYAVWITVGYFEVEKRPQYEANADPAHVYPEGYTFGYELGIDTGDVKRHRGFYIIDRSIPVGFMPGKNLNAENAVLLKRFIE